MFGLALVMLEKIKKAIFAMFNSEEKKGVFLSGFDAEHGLVTSHGVVTTDKPLHEVIDAVYSNHLKPLLKEVRYVACDVISEVIQIHAIQDLLDKSPEEYGFLIIDTEDAIS